MKIYKIVFVFIFTIPFYGQNNFATPDESGSFTNFVEIIPETNIDLNTFSGSIYVGEKFTLGKVIDKLSKKNHSFFLRYDAYNDVFQLNVTAAETGYSQLKNGPGIDIYYQKSQFIYASFKNDDNKPTQGYLKVLLKTDSTTIYYRQEKGLRLPEKASTSYGVDKSGRVTNNNYFIVNHKNGPKAEKISKKNITTFFSEDLKEKVTQITKKEKLKYKNPEDVIKLAMLLK